MTTWTDFHGHKWNVTPALGEWLTAYQAEALRRGYIKQCLDVFQTIGGAAASGGTHLEVNGQACCIDTAQTSTDMIRLARDMGADASWHRKYNWDNRGGMEHAHLNLRGIANKYANYQYTSTRYGVDHGHNGLANGARDDGPKPLSKRTYSQGIAWAKPTPAKPAPKPAPTPPTPDNTTSFRIGYGNMFGSYKPTDIDRARFRAQVGLIHAMSVSMFIALECHEGPMLDWFKTNLGAGWKVAQGTGGNHIFYDGGKYLLLASANKDLGTRWASKFNFQRKDTGLHFWAVAYHTPAGTTPTRVLARAKEMKALLAWTGNLHRVLYGIDKNNYSAYLGSPTKQLKDAGITSVYDAVPVVNAQFNSHHDTSGTDKGKHIDFLGAGSLVTFTAGTQVRTAALSDHDWLWASVTIAGT